MNDIELYRLNLCLERARKGDSLAFSELVSSHYQRVWRFILKSVHNPHDAEELAQETFFSAWKNLANFRGDSRFSTWLLGIALNLARNHCNRAPSRREVELPDTDHLDALLSHENDPSDLCEQKACLRALDQALASLPAELRETTLLVRLEGLSIEETARLLDIPPGTVKSRLSRARDKLSAAMQLHLA